MQLAPQVLQDQLAQLAQQEVRERMEQQVLQEQLEQLDQRERMEQQVLQEQLEQLDQREFLK